MGVVGDAQHIWVHSLNCAVSGAVRGVHSELLANGSTQFSVEVDPLVWQYVEWTGLTISSSKGGERVFTSERNVAAVEYREVYIMDNLSE